MRVSLSLFLFAAWASQTEANCANLVSNGSFETATFRGSNQKVSPGQTNIGDWNVTAGTVDIIGSYWQAEDGSNSIDLQGTEPGGIRSADIATQVSSVKFLQKCALTSDQETYLH